MLNLQNILAAYKQKAKILKTGVRTSVAGSFFTLIDLAGFPGAGALAAGNTAAGLVPASGETGYPVIDAFRNASSKGYLSLVEISSTVAGRLMLYDRLFHAGAYSFNSNVTLANQPSFAHRVSEGKYTGLELWVEAVTAFTGNLSIAVTYTNQDGVAGRTTGTVATGIAPIVGRMIQIPLQAGDTGIQKIESVVATVASAGTFNLVVMRPLWSGRVDAANQSKYVGMFETGLPEIAAGSALQLAVAADSTSTGLPELRFDISSD